MFEFFEKRRLCQILYSRVVLVLLLFGVLFLGTAALNAWETAHETAEKKAEAVMELALLEEQEKELQKKIAQLSTPEGIEAEIRRKFDVGEPGEGVVILVELPSEVATSTPQEESKDVLKTVLSWFGF